MSTEKSIEKKSATTPLMKQYAAVKSQHPDAIVLFRMGDFYETFGQDAIKTSGILGITLTKRANGGAADMELAGFPHHSIETYLPKLVRAGERVAICEQLEDPKTAKGLVKRGVTELVTPGVALNDNILSSKENTFLAAVFFGKKNLTGIAFLDLETVAPLAGAWIETVHPWQIKVLDFVAPLAGAWIETLLGDGIHKRADRRAPRGRVD